MWMPVGGDTLSYGNGSVSGGGYYDTTMVSHRRGVEAARIGSPCDSEVHSALASGRGFQPPPAL